MKCINCKIEVGKEFSHAIKTNQCPGCGKPIMPPEQLAAYTSLKELLTNVPNVDANLVASLVVANFELKQLFKTAPGKNISAISTAGNSETVTEVVEEDAIQDELTDKEQDAIYKAQQVAEAKKKLKRMKQDAYEDALRDQYGMGEIEGEATGPGESGGFFEENLNQIETFDRMKNEQLRQDRHEKMLSGSGGFTRSSE